MRIKQAIVFLLLAGVLAWSGCGTDTDPAGDKTASKQTLAGTISVSTHFDSSIMSRAQDFMALYPDVTIELKAAPDLGEWEGENLQQYGMRMAVEVMSGQGADLIDLSHFSAYRYATSGLLCNLYEFMDNDPDFKREDYYTNIFAAKEIGGALYALPTSFYYDMMLVSRPLAADIAADYATLDYESMLSIYETVAARHPDAPPRMMPGILKGHFWRYEFPSYYDTASGQAWFDSAEFVEYLERTEAIVTPYDPIYQEWDKTRIGVGNDSFLQSDYVFCNFDVTAIDVYNLLIDYANILPPIPIVSSNGDAVFRVMQGEYGIPTSSANRELAWEFLKFCVEEQTPPASSDREQAQAYVGLYRGWIPINIKNFRHAFRLQCELDIDMMGGSIPWQEANPRNGIEGMLDLVHSWNLQRNREAAETELSFLTGYDLESYYYYGALTAEETAALIQSRIATYLGEQR